MKIDTFVIDSNTLISAFLFEHSVPSKAYEKAKRLGKIARSNETFTELFVTLVRSKFDKYISLPNRLDFLNEVKSILIPHEILENISDCRDPKDDKFLELAVASKASCIISGDKDLLVLHPFRGIPILNATDFLQIF